MTVQALIETLRGSTTPISSYDSTKVNLGSLVIQNTGAGATDKWCGPMPGGIGRPNEESTAISPGVVAAIRWATSNKDWVFHSATGAGTTIRVGMYEADRLSGALVWKGFVTLTPPAATNHTLNGLKPALYTYSTGTVAVSGTAVTGTGTAWQTARFAVGARIGFGSTDPTQIATWYNITAITNDTSITINSSAGTIAGGTAFVIEELRLAFSTTNATATNGGMHLAKGLNFSTFTTGGTTIPAATTTDNIQAVYWLADAATVTNTLANSVALDVQASNTQHDCYVADGTASSLKIYKYNIRAALTLVSGKDTANAIQVATGAQTVSGSIGARQAASLATMSSGSAAGVKSLFIISTAPRIIRVATANVIAASTTFVSDTVTPAPPANSAIGTLTGDSLDYDPITDRFVTGGAGSSIGPVVSGYDTSNGLVDLLYGIDDMLSYQSTGSAGVSKSLRYGAGAAGVRVACSQGVLYVLGTSGALSAGGLHSIALAAHWKYQSASNTAGRLITPALSVNASAFYRVYATEVSLIAPTPDNELSWNSEPYRIYARTSGISDNSGSWTLINDTGDLSSFGAASQIQFMLEFRTLSKQCIPARVLNLCVVYESSAYIPSWLEWNVNDSNTADGTVGFTQISTNGSVPTFTIEYYREDTNALVLTQASTGSANGDFQYHNGSTWVNGTGTDTVGLRRRFVPSAGLPSGVNCYTKLITS